MNEPPLGIYSTSDLKASGSTRTSIASGDLQRVRRGWYADAGADDDAKAAVRIGGVLTASSATRHYRMWTPADDRLHVVVAHNAARLRLPTEPAGSAAATSPFARPNSKVCLHWAKAPLISHAVATPLQIATDAAHCLAFDDAVAIADSALNAHLFRLDELREVAPRLSAWCDPASQSGTETYCRVRLRRRNIRVRTQVSIAGVGRVDLLVGDRLVVECDSAGFHDDYRSERDYDRDMALIRQGYIVRRLKYRHVVFEWEKAEELILSIVRARRHLWRGRASAGTVVSL